MSSPSRIALNVVRPDEPTPGAPVPGGTIPPDADLSDWVRATAPRAVAYATSLVRDRATAEDLVQDCYCRLLAKQDVYDLRSDGLKILMRSVSNACLTWKARRRPFLSIFGPKGEPPEVADPATPEPGRAMLGRELSDAIQAGLSRLPIQQRAALELRSLGHSLAEVAEILEITSSHAGVMIHRARAAMEEFLAPYLEGRPS